MCRKACPPVSPPLPSRQAAPRHNEVGESVGLEPDRPAFCGGDSSLVTNWQHDLGHVPSRTRSLAEPQLLPGTTAPLPRPAPSHLACGSRLHLGLCDTTPCLPPQCAGASAKAGFPPCLCSGRSNSESNGPVEQVHPSCCKHYFINKVKRTQTQVHCPKGGNNT